MKLYGSLGSPFVARVVLHARLKGLDLAAEPFAAGIKSAEYLARNPIGKMPVLELDGEWIPESAVICELLEDLYPALPGLEGTPVERARARTLARIFDTYVYPHASVLFRNMDPRSRDEAAVAAAKTGYDTAIGYLEHYLVAAPYAAGAHVTLADCTLLPAFAIFRKTVVPLLGVSDPTQGTGKLARWWSALPGHPVTGPFMPEYDAAVDALLASFR